MKRVLTPDNANDGGTGADYTLDPEHGCRITYRGVSIHIFTPPGRLDVSVEMFLGDAYDENLIGYLRHSP